MNDMQKRRLIKACIDNEIDTRELDPSLKYDENQEILSNLIEQIKFKNYDEHELFMAGQLKWNKLQNKFQKEVSMKDKIEDWQKTEKKLVKERDIELGRKQKDIQLWKRDPLDSKIDIEMIDDEWDKYKKKEKQTE